MICRTALPFAALALPFPLAAQDKPKDEARPSAAAPAYTANTASQRFTGTFGGQRVGQRRQQRRSHRSVENILQIVNRFQHPNHQFGEV